MIISLSPHIWGLITNCCLKVSTQAAFLVIGNWSVCIEPVLFQIYCAVADSSCCVRCIRNAFTTLTNVSLTPISANKISSCDYPLSVHSDSLHGYMACKWCNYTTNIMLTPNNTNEISVDCMQLNLHYCILLSSVIKHRIAHWSASSDLCNKHVIPGIRCYMECQFIFANRGYKQGYKIVLPKFYTPLSIKYYTKMQHVMWNEPGDQLNGSHRMHLKPPIEGGHIPTSWSPASFHMTLGFLLHTITFVFGKKYWQRMHLNISFFFYTQYHVAVDLMVVHLIDWYINIYYWKKTLKAEQIILIKFFALIKIQKMK